MAYPVDGGRGNPGEGVLNHVSHGLGTELKQVSQLTSVARGDVAIGQVDSVGALITYC